MSKYIIYKHNVLMWLHTTHWCLRMNPAKEQRTQVLEMSPFPIIQCWYFTHMSTTTQKRICCFIETCSHWFMGLWKASLIDHRRLHWKQWLFPIVRKEDCTALKSSKMAHFVFKCNKEDYLSVQHSCCTRIHVTALVVNTAWALQHSDNVCTNICTYSIH